MYKAGRGWLAGWMVINILLGERWLADRIVIYMVGGGMVGTGRMVIYTVGTGISYLVVWLSTYIVGRGMVSWPDKKGMVSWSDG